MKHFLLFYDVAEDYLARPAEFREANLDRAWAAHARGELVLGGALADPIDAAVLLFAGDSAHAAEAFARDDPYVLKRPRHAVARARVANRRGHRGRRADPAAPGHVGAAPGRWTP